MRQAALETNTEGPAEAEIGRWVYRRISRLMDAMPGSKEGKELAYLAAVAASIEEYGEAACGDTDLTL